MTLGEEQDQNLHYFKRKTYHNSYSWLPRLYQALELHTDASMSALGAVHYQAQKEAKRVIAYGADI